MSLEQAGWYADPTRRHTYRYWDGSRWSNQVTDGGPAGLDPIDLDESTATTPPAPGTQAPGTNQTEDRPQPGVEVTQRSGGSSLAGILGVLVGVAIVIVILFIIFNNADDDTTDPTDAPLATVTTQAPTETEAPPPTTTP